MIAFSVLSLASALGLLLVLSYRRFHHDYRANQRPFFQRLRAYFRWGAHALVSLFQPEGRQRVRSFLLAWLASYPRPWEKLVFWAALLSFLYLAGSGLGFALFSPRGLFGLVLLLHLAAGGIFSVCLSLLVILRAKNYLSLEPGQGQRERGNSLLKTTRASLLKPVLFWGFVLSGFLLGLTVLLSMLPYFSFQTQLDLLVIHRYSGLLSVLLAMLFLDQVISRP